MMRMWLVAALVLVGVLAGRPAEAAQCSIDITPVTFGAYNVFTTAPLDSTGTVLYNCNGGARNVVITISKGQGTFNARTLTKGAEKLEYNLFLDAARTVIWGNGNGVSEVYSDPNPPNKTDVTVPIFGRIPSEQDITAGPYADSVSVEINF